MLYVVLPANQTRTRIQEWGIQVAYKGTGNSGGMEPGGWMLSLPTGQILYTMHYETNSHRTYELYTGILKVSNANPTCGAKQLASNVHWLWRLTPAALRVLLPGAWGRRRSNRHIEPTGFLDHTFTMLCQAWNKNRICLWNLSLL